MIAPKSRKWQKSKLIQFIQIIRVYTLQLSHSQVESKHSDIEVEF